MSTGVVMVCSAYLSQTEQANQATSNFAPYDQYEVSIPMEIAGDCLQTVSKQCLLVTGTGCCAQACHNTCAAWQTTVVHAVVVVTVHAMKMAGHREATAF